MSKNIKVVAENATIPAKSIFRRRELLDTSDDGVASASFWEPFNV
jgi:hypothetical protein